MSADTETKIQSLPDLSRFAQAFIDTHPEGVVLGLSGELGAGKTAFVRAVVQTLSERAGAGTPRVTSPTYVLHQSYSALKPAVDHFDLYRFESATETSLLEMGYFEILENCRNRKGFLFVEWPERAEPPSLLGLTETLHLSFFEGGRLAKVTRL